jgi:hypothetical protein
VSLAELKIRLPNDPLPEARSEPKMGVPFFPSFRKLTYWTGENGPRMSSELSISPSELAMDVPEKSVLEASVSE